MAQHADIIGSLSSGSGVPAGFTARWAGSNIAYTVADDPAAPGGKKLTIEGGSSATRNFISRDDVNSDEDRATAKVVAIGRVNTFSSANSASLAGPMARGGGSSGDELGNTAVFGQDGGGQLRAIQYPPNVIYTSSAGAYDLGDLRFIVQEVSGTTETVSMYAMDDVYGTPIRTDTHTIQSANSDNWIGLFSFAANFDLDILWLSVGTGEDDAPLPQPATLSAASGEAAGSTTANLSVSTTRGNGGIFHVVTTSATQPSKTQIEAGENHTGAAAADSGSQSVTAIGEQDSAATGLTASTQYFVHFFQRDNMGLETSVVSSGSFTTEAASGLVLRNDIPLYDDLGENTLTDDTDVNVVALTEASPPVVTGEYTADIVSGYISISDTPFDTETEGFTMQLRKGTFSRVVDGTVVTS